jgi:hypothetical protein
MENLRYPIGRFENEPYDNQTREKYIEDIKMLPQIFRKQANALSTAQLIEPYRPGGWTARQLIHHVADSHLNAYIRFKLILTESLPTIKPYQESAWAELSDTHNTPVEVSLNLLDNLHTRWHQLLLRIEEQEWKRQGFHPEHKRNIPLSEFLALYSWHGRHHTAHLRLILDR